MDLTIRQGVFETNSSSTHTITITPTTEYDLIEGNVLYLSEYKSYVEDNNNIVALTPIDKTALIATLFCSYFESEDLHYGQSLEFILTKLANNLGVSAIDIEDYPYINPYDDQHFTFEDVDYYIDEVINEDVKIQILKEEW